jgi:hypothetical protein
LLFLFGCFSYSEFGDRPNNVFFFLFWKNRQVASEFGNRELADLLRRAESGDVTGGGRGGGGRSGVEVLPAVKLDWGSGEEGGNGRGGGEGEGEGEAEEGREAGRGGRGRERGIEDQADGGAGGGGFGNEKEVEGVVGRLGEFSEKGRGEGGVGVRDARGGREIDAADVEVVRGGGWGDAGDVGVEGRERGEGLAARDIEGQQAKL